LYYVGKRQAFSLQKTTICYTPKKDMNTHLQVDFPMELAVVLRMQEGEFGEEIKRLAGYLTIFVGNH